MLSTRSTPPLNAKHSAFVYQLAAIEAVKNLEYAALFHEQGLGKTKIALDLILNWLRRDVVDSVLIITKKGLINNWEKEIKVHTNLSYGVLSGNRIRNSSLYNRPFQLYLSHYEAIYGNKKGLRLLLQTRKVGVVLDEAHRIKNPKGLVAQALFELASSFKRRVIMTGTPVANRPYDIWAQIFFLDEGKALGDCYKQFKERYDLPKDIINYRNKDYESSLANIYESIRPFAVRETKESAELKLPEKTLLSLAVDMEKEQAKLYRKYKFDLRAEVFRNGELVTDNVDQILKQLLRLVQVASNPLLVDESYKLQPGKCDALVKILSQLEENEKLIVWTNFVQNANYLSKFLSKWGTLKIHGKMAINDRNRNIEKFLNDPNLRVLVATPGAAKEGLTLTVANYAVFYDRNFSLNDWLQAQDRIHRISQLKTCVVINLLARNSIDFWVDQLLLCKLRLANLALGDFEQEEMATNSELKSIFEEILAQ